MDDLFYSYKTTLINVAKCQDGPFSILFQRHHCLFFVLIFFTLVVHLCYMHYFLTLKLSITFQSQINFKAH